MRDRIGEFDGQVQQMMIPGQIGDAHLLDAGLARAQHLAGTAQLEILLGDVEAVVALAHGLQSGFGHVAQRRLIQQHATGGVAAAPDPAAQLMQLRQAQPFSVVDDHQAGVGHINADLDHRGRHQQLNQTIAEALHDDFLVGRLEPAMHQINAQLRQRLAQCCGGLLGGLRHQLLGFLDDGAHPVGLATGRAGIGQPLDHLRATLAADDHGGDRLAPGRQFINHRYRKTGIGGHRQRAWNRCRGHDQLVRTQVAGAALVAQRQTLADTKAMLFIDDDQAKLVKLNAFLHQRMGAHNQAVPGGNARQRGLALVAGDPTAEPDHIDPQRHKPLAERAQMLFCQQFGRRHQCHLLATGQRHRSGSGGHHGLAGADIALQQAQHRRCLRQVSADFRAHPLLRCGRCKRQLLLQLLPQLKLLQAWRAEFL